MNRQRHFIDYSSPSNAIDGIIEDAIAFFDRQLVSFELQEGIDAVIRTWDRTTSYMDLEMDLESLDSWYGSKMTPQERAAFRDQLIDPMLDVIR